MREVKRYPEQLLTLYKTITGHAAKELFKIFSDQSKTFMTQFAEIMPPKIYAALDYLRTESEKSATPLGHKRTQPKR